MANTNESLSLEAIVNRHFSTESQESPATPVTTTGTTKAPETPVASARNKAVRKQPAETVDPEDEDDAVDESPPLASEDSVRLLSETSPGSVCFIPVALTTIIKSIGPRL